MKKIVLIVFLNSAYISNAQNLPVVIPPSPNATSLAKFVDLPVDLYHGIPQIDIPLYSFQVGNLTVPISLSYHAGGIKVAEASSNIGLGWALNSGGVITRSINGLYDEKGWLTTSRLLPPTNPDCLENTNPLIRDYMNFVDQGLYDTEPDMFYYNFNGISGKFVFDKDGVPRNIQAKKIKIEFTMVGTINDWKITTEDGTIYKFSNAETVVSGGINANNYPSAWYLTEISFPNTDQKIFFNYNQSNYCYSNANYEILKEGISATTTHTSYTCLTSPVISQIIFPSGSVEFTEGNYRYDIMGTKVMDRITIKNNQGAIKSYKLNHKYFGATTDLIDDDGLATVNTAASSAKRLCLTNIVEYDKNNIQQNPPYSFDYYSFFSDGILPDRVNSKAIDFWGYYNGHNENITTIPPHISNYAQYSGLFIPGGNRMPEEEYTKVGTLSKVTYPTGGYTDYVFEENMGTAPSFPTNNFPISANYVIGECHISGNAQFVINDNITNNATIHINLEGQLDNYTLVNCAGNTSPSLPVANDPNTFIYFEIVNITDPANPFVVPVTARSGQLVIPRPSPTSMDIVLPNGTYKIITVKGMNNTPLVDANANFSYPASLSVSGYYYRDVNKKLGGLRIKKMTSTDPVTSKTIIKTFEYTDENGITTGKTSGAFKFNHFGDIVSETLLVRSEEWTSYFQSPLTLQQGAYVGYSKVTVYNEEHSNNVSANGKIEYFYSNPIDVYAIGDPYWIGTIDPAAPELACSLVPIKICYSDYFGSYSSSFPFAPAVSTDFNKGLLLKEINYKTNTIATSYTKVKEITNFYKDDYLGQSDVRVSNTADVKAMKIGFSHVLSKCGNTVIVDIYPQYYFIPMRFSKLIKTEESIYDVNGVNPIKQVQDFSYDNLAHMQLTKNVVHKSDGNTVTTQNLYPLDYTNITGFIGDMKVANIIVKPIESVTYLTNVTNSAISILKGTATTYKQAPNLGLPSDVKILETTTPIPLSQFKFSNQLSSGVLPQTYSISSFSADNKYSPTASVLLSYDGKGNITSVHKENNVITSYIWGYYKQYPVAQVIGANQATIATLVDQTVLDNSLSTDQQIRAELNKLRIGLANTNALVTTYTYKPLVGITSETDPNGKTTYYEYDAFNRLILIRDKDNNFLKKICYNYAGQVENCTLPCPPNSTPIWQNTTEFRCQQGSCGNTGYQEQKQIDVNTCTNYAPQWILAGYNPTACPSQTCVTLTSTNVTNFSGYTASYYNTSSGITYNFAVSTAGGLQTLGTVPAGNYTLTISRTTGVPIYGTFKSGCWKQIITGNAATFYNVAVSSTTCNSITVNIEGL